MDTSVHCSARRQKEHTYLSNAWQLTKLGSARWWFGKTLPCCARAPVVHRFCVSAFDVRIQQQRIRTEFKEYPLLLAGKVTNLARGNKVFELPLSHLAPYAYLPGGRAAIRNKVGLGKYASRHIRWCNFHQPTRCAPLLKTTSHQHTDTIRLLLSHRDPTPQPSLARFLGANADRNLSNAALKGCVHKFNRQRPSDERGSVCQGHTTGRL